MSENALIQFEKAFTSNGFHRSPRGLRALVTTVRRQRNETIDQCRRRLYRRIFGILWYGNHVGQGQFQAQNEKGSPTYVYPAFLKEAIRVHVSGNLKEFEDPEGPGVYRVTVEDLGHARWPAPRN